MIFFSKASHTTLYTVIFSTLSLLVHYDTSRKARIIAQIGFHTNVTHISSWPTPESFMPLFCARKMAKRKINARIRRFYTNIFQQIEKFYIVQNILYMWITVDISRQYWFWVGALGSVHIRLKERKGGRDTKIMALLVFPGCE